MAGKALDPKAGKKKLPELKKDVKKKLPEAGVKQKKTLQGAILQMQSAVGNKAVVQMIRNGMMGDVLQAKSGGSKMPENVQKKMESSFGADFSGVKVHEGPEAPSVGALAYTQGSNIHFAPGTYSPDTQKGQSLLGHELAHVVQQREGRVKPTTQAKGLPVNDDSALEKEADVAGIKAAKG